MQNQTFIAVPFRRNSEPLPASIILLIFGPLLAVVPIVMIWVSEFVLIALEFQESARFLLDTRWLFVSGLIVLSVVELLCWKHYQKVLLRTYGPSKVPHPAEVRLTESSVEISRRLTTTFTSTALVSWRQAMLDEHALSLPRLYFSDSRSDLNGFTRFELSEILSVVYLESLSQPANLLIFFLESKCILTELRFSDRDCTRMIKSLTESVPFFNGKIATGYRRFPKKIVFHGERPKENFLSRPML